MKKLSDMQTESENTSTYLVTSSVGIALSHTAPTVYGRFSLPRIPKKKKIVKPLFTFFLKILYDFICFSAVIL